MKKYILPLIFVLCLVFALTGYCAKTITARGNAQVDTAFKKFGTGSLLLDGTDDWIDTPDHDDWNFGAGNFTIDFWVRFNVATDGEQYVFCGQDTDEDNWFRFMRAASGNKLEVQFFASASYNARYYTDNAWQPAVDTWYHLALVRSGTTCYIFVDGVSLAVTQNVAFGTTPDYTGNFEIGTYYGELQEVNGWIDEFRVSKGVARWTSGFTPPTSAYSADADTHLLIHCDGADESTDFYDDDVIPSAGITWNGITITKFNGIPITIPLNTQ